MCRLGPWLAGLYIVAQIFSVVPSISCDSAHAAGGALVFSQCEACIGTDSHDHHDPGDADHAACHHALQDLNGVLTSLDRSEIALVHIAVSPLVPRALAEADPVLLEHPPNPFLSI
jgi:hypothetical protein